MILIAEDEEPLARVYQKALQTNGFTDVEYLGNGSEALAHIKRKNPDLVIIDLALPDMNGVHLAQKARAGGYKGPLVLMSGAVSNDPGWIYSLALPEFPVPSFELELQKPLKITELLDLAAMYVPRNESVPQAPEMTVPSSSS